MSVGKEICLVVKGIDMVERGKQHSLRSLLVLNKIKQKVVAKALAVSEGHVSLVLSGKRTSARVIEYLEKLLEAA